MLERLFVYLNYIRFLPHIVFFITSRKKETIKEDVVAYREEYGLKGSGLFVFVQLLSHNTSFRSLFYYRIGKRKWLCQWLGKGMVNLIIPPSVTIGSGLLLFHSYGTILNAKSIGSGCRIVHNVTLGARSGGVPIIGNHVEILPNAVITGNIRIGDHCVIGPGAVVFKDIPDHCVVVGNPAYILKKDGVIVNQKL